MYSVQPFRSYSHAPMCIGNTYFPGDPAYPGLSAVFDNGKDAWEVLSHDPNLRRCIRFTSTSENSLLESFELLGYWDDSVAIAVCYKKGAAFDVYLRSKGIEIEEDGFFLVSDLDELRIIFSIICGNNKIPLKQKEEMAAIMMHETCAPQANQERDFFLLNSNPYEIPALPYPGLPAVFDKGDGDWNKIFYTCELRRCIRLRSTSENSLLEYFDLLGYWDGKICISLCYQKEQGFDEYLRRHDIKIQSDGHCFTGRIEAIRTIYTILSQNNEIPEERLKEIYSIIARGCCDPSRPPTPPRRFPPMHGLLL